MNTSGEISFYNLIDPETNQEYKVFYKFDKTSLRDVFYKQIFEDDHGNPITDAQVDGHKIIKLGPHYFKRAENPGDRFPAGVENDILIYNAANSPVVMNHIAALEKIIGDGSANFNYIKPAVMNFQSEHIELYGYNQDYTNGYLLIDAYSLNLYSQYNFGAEFRDSWQFITQEQNSGGVWKTAGIISLDYLNLNDTPNLDATCMKILYACTDTAVAGVQQYGGFYIDGHVVVVSANGKGILYEKDSDYANAGQFTLMPKKYIDLNDSEYPQVTEAQRLAIASPRIGQHVYQTDVTEGVYVYKSTGWVFAY